MNWLVGSLINNKYQWGWDDTDRDIDLDLIVDHTKYIEITIRPAKFWIIADDDKWEEVLKIGISEVKYSNYYFNFK